MTTIKGLATTNQVTRATRFLGDLGRTANPKSPLLLNWINAISADSLDHLLAGWRALHRNGNAIAQFIRRDRASLEWVHLNAQDLTTAATDSLYNHLTGREVERAFTDPQGRLVVLTQSSTATRRVATLEKAASGNMRSFFYSRAYNRGTLPNFPPLSANGLTPDYSGNPTWLFPVTGNQRNIVRIRMTGTRNRDFRLANIAAGFPGSLPPLGPNGEQYTWHHMDDFDPRTDECTMQLVRRIEHERTIPHTGSFRQRINYNDN